MLVPLLLVVGSAVAGCGGDDGQNGSSAGDGAGTTKPVVLFIRGASGTSPLDDDHLTDIDQEGDLGFLSWHEALTAAGFDVRQEIEPEGGGVDLSAALDGVDIVVLGSNNAAYDTTQVEELTEFVRNGGGVLAFSDANYGVGDSARSSDNTFLAPFDLELNFDSGGDGPQTMTSDQFTRPDHPILDGVEGIGWYGPSAVTIVDLETRVTPQILIPAQDPVALSEGPEPETRPADANDAALAVVEFGGGRVAAFYDRDTFYNDGSAVGMSLSTLGNKVFAVNLIEWLAGER